MIGDDYGYGAPDRLDVSGFEWSADQEAAVSKVMRWFGGPHPSQLRFGGLAGTGKTTMAARLPTALGLRSAQVAYCAYTGKAAQVLTRKLQALGSSAEATTIHSLIYRPQDRHCRECPSSRGGDCHGTSGSSCACGVTFRQVESLDPALRLIIVDEASMVDEEIYNDLLSYGVPVVWIGDHGQLPPVRGTFSLMGDLDVRLEKIHRQAAGSPILKLAMLAREGESLPYKCYAPGVVKTKVFGLDIDTEEDHLILCYTNDNRTWLNSVVRHFLGYPVGVPVVEDRVICLRNNRSAGIFNGMLGTIKRIGKRLGAYAVTIQPDGPHKPYTGAISAKQFGNPQTLAGGGLDLWDYGYCLTVHKAQGSEADRVTLLDDFPFWDANRSRWLYTGITRAKQELMIIDFHGKRPPIVAVDDDPVLIDD